MKRTWYAGLSFYVVAPVVSLVACCALVLTILAAYENYRLGQATDQVIQVVSLARELRVSKEIPADRALATFYARMGQVAPSSVVLISSPFMGEKQEQGITNPWGDVMRVFFYPAMASVRLEMPVSSAACRRLLLFYANDVRPLGVRRVDVRSSDAGAVWRMVYQEQDNAAVLLPDAIYGGCGEDAQDILSLTFYL